MKKLHMPLFSNSCGKIFANTIVLASANNETELSLQSIKKFSFKKSITPSSLFFIMLPLMLLVLPSFIEKDETFIASLFYIIGALLLITAIFKAEKAFSFTVYMKDGTARSVSVWEGNRSDAKQFVTKANEMVSSKNNSTAPVREVLNEKRILLGRVMQ